MRNPVAERLLAVSAAIMAAFYIIGGSIVAYYPIQLGYLTPTLRLLLGIAIIAYGIFRGYRAYRRYREVES
jgi:hypothetical protein